MMTCFVQFGALVFQLKAPDSISGRKKNNIKFFEFWPSWESNPGRHVLQSNMHQLNEAVKFHDITLSVSSAMLLLRSL